MYRLCVIACLLLCASIAVAERVEKIVDGDTFYLADGRKIRRIGGAGREVEQPNKPGEHYARESSALLESLILGKEVRLEPGEELKDSYDRLLYYVWVDDTLLVNLELIEQGCGMAYLSFPNKYEKEFLDAEHEARRAAVGRWACPRSNPVLPSDEVQEGDSVIVYVAKCGKRYHREHCDYLSKGKIPITLTLAKELGYTPCRRCNP